MTGHLPHISDQFPVSQNGNDDDGNDNDDDDDENDDDDGDHIDDDDDIYDVSNHLTCGSAS